MTGRLQEKYDVVIAGGGSAGVMAAVQAARAGARTALIEKNGMLGGTTTVGSVNFPGLFHAWGKQVIAGIGWESVLRTVELEGSQLPDFTVVPERHWHQQVRINRFLYAAVLDEMCMEAGVELKLHTMIGAALEQADGVQLTLVDKAGMQMVEAAKVVDATGDADVCGMLDYERVKSEQMQPGTLINEIDGYAFAEIDPSALQACYKQALAHGDIRETDHPAGEYPFYADLRAGSINMHVPGIDGGDSLSRTQAELEARRTLLRIYRFLRTVPGCEQLRIRYVANEVGIRETWRIIGEATISEEDYLSGKLWEDAIAYSYYPIDLHHPSSNTIIKKYPDEGIVATIPLGSLLPYGSNHVLAAGRIISGDQMANSAYRVQATCMATGQAAGAAAALAAANGQSLRDLSYTELCRLLLQHGAIIPGQS